MLKDWSTSNSILYSLESFLIGLSLLERDVLLNKPYQGLDNLRKPINESSIKIAETHERLDFFNVSRLLLIYNYLHFGRVYT